MEKSVLSLQHKVDNCIFAYRTSLHSTTNKTPTLLMLNRNLRSQTDLKPNMQREVHDKQFSHVPNNYPKDFEIGQEVLSHDYRGDKWNPDRTPDIHSGHVDQILDTHSQKDISSSPRIAISDTKTPAISTSPETEIFSQSKTSAATTESTGQVPSHYPERHRIPPKRLELKYLYVSHRYCFNSNGKITYETFLKKEGNILLCVCS